MSRYLLSRFLLIHHSSWNFLIHAYSYLHSQGYQQTVPPQDKDSTIRVTICQRSRNAELHSQ